MFTDADLGSVVLCFALLAAAGAERHLRRILRELAAEVRGLHFEQLVGLARRSVCQSACCRGLFLGALPALTV